MKTQENRKGNWFLTYTGKQFWPLDPRPEDICIEDIAHHLSLLCRFNGAVRWFYSVAQHSILVESITPGLQSFMHDATEAYYGDMIRPLKVSMPEYRAAEHLGWEAICARYNLPVEMHPSVKVADNIALMTERRDLLVESPISWSNPAVPLPTRIQPMHPSAAEYAFLMRWEELKQIESTVMQ